MHRQFLGSAFVVAAAFAAPQAASAASVTYFLNEFTGDDAQMKVVLDDAVQAGKVKVTITTDDGDILGLFGDIANTSLLPGLSIENASVSFSNFTKSVDNVLSAGGGNNLNGFQDTKFDFGVKLGSTGTPNGLMQTVSFFFKHSSQALDVSAFGPRFGGRLQATSGQEGSSKLVGEVGNVVPTPAAAMAGLAMLGGLVLRRRSA